MASDVKIALIASGSALLGSLIGGIISIHVSDEAAQSARSIAQQTAQSQSKENQITFVRQQQQVIYTQAVSDSHKLEALELQCLPAPGAQRPTKESLQSALSVLQSDGPTIELIGSANAFFEFGHVLDSHGKVIESCTDPAAISTAIDAMRKDMQTFTDQGRTDVQGAR